MKNNHLCPPPERILSWLDGEAADIGLQAHIDDCEKCRELVTSLQQENKMLFQFFDQMPLMPDLSDKIMSRLEKPVSPYQEMHTLFSYLLVTSLSLAMVILHYFFTGWFREGFWPVTLAKFLYLASNISHNGYDALKHLLSRMAAGEPLLPAFIVVIIAILINLVLKRRMSNA